MYHNLNNKTIILCSFFLYLSYWPVICFPVGILDTSQNLTEKIVATLYAFSILLKHPEKLMNKMIPLGPNS